VTSETLLDFACTAAIFGLSALAVALAFGTTRTRASRFLMGYFACLAIDSAVGLMVVGWPLPSTAVRWLHVVNVPIAYLFGPMLYGYVCALVTEGAGLSWRHALPSVVVLAFSLANALWTLDATPTGAIAFHLSFHAWVVSGILYLAFAVRHIQRSRPMLEERHADETALGLVWLRRLAALIAVIWILMAFNRFPSLADAPQSRWLGTLLDGLTTVALYLLAWFGLRQRVLGAHEPLERIASDAALPYARSGLGADQCATIAAELSRLVADEKLYAVSTFDLAALSQRSGWPQNYVSQALNQGLGRNFFEFVNGFRIAEAERLLADSGERRTILDIALACGFGSKSTFNAVFKRMTGVTPSEYRRASDCLREESVV